MIIDITDMLQENLIRMYEESFKKHWELPFISDYFKEEDHFTYGQAAREIAKLHLLFKKCKVKKGDKIALFGRNNVRWCLAYVATITYGAVIVPILQDFNSNDVQHIINHSDSVLLFVGDQYWDSIVPRNVERIKAVFSLTDYSCTYDGRGGAINAFTEQWEEKTKEAYPDGFSVSDIKFAEAGNEEMVLLNYTSGTTGFSKGVMVSVNNLTGNVVYGIRKNLHWKGSRGLSFLPLAHTYGCTLDFLLPIAVGAHITLLGKIPSPKILIEAAQQVKPNIIFTVPLVIEKIYRKQIIPQIHRKTVDVAMKIPILREKIYESINKELCDAFGGNFSMIVAGGAPLNREVEEFLCKIGFPITVGYGMTECAPLISFARNEEFVPTSCGIVLEGIMEVRIDSPDPQNVVGEIQTRGENVMLGYYKNEEATKAIFTEDGWLRTGDMGTLGPDNSLFIRGRCKSMILSGNGQNIYPEEIEAKLNNMPGVAESLVMERNGRIVALVYPDYDQSSSATSNGVEKFKTVMEENKIAVNKMLAGYEQISEVILFPTEFEKTPKKSIKRYLYNV